jgi:hypothetical protein
LAWQQQQSGVDRVGSTWSAGLVRFLLFLLLTCMLRVPDG